MILELLVGIITIIILVLFTAFVGYIVIHYIEPVIYRDSKTITLKKWLATYSSDAKLFDDFGMYFVIGLVVYIILFFVIFALAGCWAVGNALIG